MHQIKINEYNGNSTISVSLLDQHGNTITSKHNITSNVAESYIMHLKQVYKLPENTLMTDYNHDNNNKINNVYSATLSEFIEG